MSHQLKLCILLLILSDFCHGTLSIGAGIGPGVYATENKLRNFKLTVPGELFCGSSLFKSKPAPFLACIFDGTIEPHENALISGVITGGVLPKGSAYFLITESCKKTSYVPAVFNGHFFISAYGSGSLNFPITNTALVQTGLGYGLNSEYLNVYTKRIPSLFGRFTRQFLGPFVTGTVLYKKSQFSFSVNYQLMFGTIHNTITYPKERIHLLITIPGIMNSLSATGTCSFNSAISGSLTVSYSQLNNYKKGHVTTFIQSITQSNTAFSQHYFIKSLALYLQVNVTY